MAVSQGRDNHAAMHAGFGWQVPRHFNMAEACCARWARQADAGRRVAVMAHGVDGPQAFLTFAALQDGANRLANVLRTLGVARGDRVAIVMPQRPETAIAYMAVLQMGAVAVPLSMLFGPEALDYRLQDSDAVAAICDPSALAGVEAVRASCPALRAVLVADEAGSEDAAPDTKPYDSGDAAADAQSKAALKWTSALASASPRFSPVRTLASDGAVLIYTSGTTGPPKGALIPHRALLGNLPGFVCSQNWFGFDPHATPRSARLADALPTASKAIFWSPADWAWTGGLMDALLPTLYFGRPIVAHNGRFSPELAFTLMQAHGVTHTFLFPTALKAMMKAYPRPTQFRLKLQAIMSAGEAVGDAVFAYCQTQLGVTVNEMFGQTEINYVVGNCAMNGRTGAGIGWPARPGSMGRGYPGHRVAVIDDDGNECAIGVPGDVAVHQRDIHGTPDPIFFLGYWKNSDATQRKFTAGWCRTGDLATRDADGYLWYQGRADDVFKAAGYRIGPSEIENCLVKHPAVANAAVVPKPDAERGAVVKAFVVLSADFVDARQRSTSGTAAFEAQLTLELQLHVKGKLAPYEYPKEIEFIDALPMTTTGKVQRRVLRLREEERARG